MRRVLLILVALAALGLFFGPAWYLVTDSALIPWGWAHRIGAAVIVAGIVLGLVRWYREVLKA